ncbi:Tripartite tricarboxylate transporter family receptor [compost metagenome]
MIGADAVAKAAPDGYTLLLTVSSVVQTPYMYAKPLFDPMRDLVPVTDICTTNMVLTAGATGPRTLADVVRIAKQAPGKLAYATYGLGSGSHLYMEVFGSAAGISLIHAPYKGEAPIVNDLLGGQIALGTLSPMVVRQHLRGGKLTPLAVSGDARAPMLPDVPTFEELGYRGLSGPSWFGLFTTRGTPQPVVEKVAADVAAVLAAPDVRQRLADLGLNVKTSTPAAFAKLAKTDQAYWSEVIHKHNIRLD